MSKEETITYLEHLGYDVVKTYPQVKTEIDVSCQQGIRLSVYTGEKNRKNFHWVCSVCYQDKETKEIIKRCYYSGRHWFNVYASDDDWKLSHGQWFGLMGIEILNFMISKIKENKND